MARFQAPTEHEGGRCVLCGKEPDGYYLDTGNGALVCMNCAQLICYMVKELNKELEDCADAMDAVERYNRRHGRRDKKEDQQMNEEEKRLIEQHKNGWKQDAPIEAFWIPIKVHIINGSSIHPDEIKRLIDKKIKDREDLKSMAARLFVHRYDKLRERYEGQHLLAKMKDIVARDPAIGRMGKDIVNVMLEILNLGWL